MDAYREHRDAEREGRAWLAWHIVALDRQKHLPPLERLLGLPTAPARAAQVLTGPEADDARRAHEALVRRMTKGVRDGG